MTGKPAQQQQCRKRHANRREWLTHFGSKHTQHNTKLQCQCSGFLSLVQSQTKLMGQELSALLSAQVCLHWSPAVLCSVCHTETMCVEVYASSWSCPRKEYSQAQHYAAAHQTSSAESEDTHIPHPVKTMGVEIGLMTIFYIWQRFSPLLHSMDVTVSTPTAHQKRPSAGFTRKI